MSADLRRTDAPSIARGAMEGRRFRALVVDGTKAAVEELRLLPLAAGDVVVRTQAVHVSYTMANWARRALSLVSNPGVADWPLGPPYILGHYSVGIVEAVGEDVRRTRPGERVLVSGTPACGVCRACLQGRGDWCQLVSNQPYPVARRADGTQITASFAIGGMAELTIVHEESVVPVWTDLSSLDLAMLVGAPGMGLGAALIQAPVEPGANVAVFGCGPLGMGAVQGARLGGANRIIAIDPIQYRRDAARGFGATDVLDPSTEENLVERIRVLCDAGSDRPYAGGRTRAKGSQLRGADFAIEAVGGELFPPRVEKSPDPSGVLPMKQAYDATCSTGHVSYMGAAQIGEISFRPETLAVSGRTIHGLQMGGISAMRDYPRFVTLVEKGLFDVKSMATFTCKLDDFHQAFEHVAYRTSLASVIVFDS